MAEYKVARVGWDKQNEIIPLILLDKLERDKLKVDVGTIVDVKHGSNMTQASVCPQFTDLINSGQTILSTKLASLLDCIEGDTVEIIGESTDEKKNAFREKVEAELKAHIQQVQQNLARIRGNSIGVLPNGGTGARGIIIIRHS